MTTKKSIELVKEGFANGVAQGGPLSDSEKQSMIEDAAAAFGKFLDALRCDWCPPNRGCNSRRKYYGSRYSKNTYKNVRYPSWKLATKNRKQWMKKNLKIEERSNRYGFTWTDIKF